MFTTLSIPLLMMLPVTTMGSSPDLLAGASQIDITPPLGTPMRGYYYERLASHVHDPLYARALVLSEGDQTLVIITLDLIDVAPQASRSAVETISARHNIPAEQIIITSTHTHTGPALSADYEAWLTHRIVDAVTIAINNRKPAVLRVGSGHEAGVSFHRRFLMKDGTVRFNPGALNPDIVKPMGPIDPEVGILSVETPDGEVIAVLVNFAIHLDTVGGTEISADFPFFLERLLRKVLGESTVVMFALAPCGNINHFNVRSPETLKGFERAERIGHALAGAVIREFPGLEPMAAASLRASAEVLPLTVPSYTSAEVAQARINAVKQSDHESSTPEIREARKILWVADRGGEPLPGEVKAFGIDDLGIVALPGEIFVELGLDLKQRSPYRHNLILTLSGHTAMSYIPNREAYPHGAYEVEVSRVVAGEGERLIDSAVSQLERLKSGGY